MCSASANLSRINLLACLLHLNTVYSIYSLQTISNSSPVQLQKYQKMDFLFIYLFIFCLFWNNIYRYVVSVGMDTCVTYLNTLDLNRHLLIEKKKKKKKKNQLIIPQTISFYVEVL